MFKEINTKPDYPAMENRILAFWDERSIFDKLREKNKDGDLWRFLDGPITANNPMGVHHAWGRMLKDVFHRYHGMCGHHMRYQNGFDCQGLWVEVEVEKEMGFGSKKDIEAFGVDRFVKACKDRVIKFSKQQTEQSIRLGYWMDWDNSYFTMSEENNYTIWRFLKKCHERGWLYEGEDVMPWCTRCGTGISQQEMHEGYKVVADDAVFVRFSLRDRENEFLLVWTTTPWTLTSNVGCAVNPDLPYARVRCGDAIYYIAEEALHFKRKEEESRQGSWLDGVPQLSTVGEILDDLGGYEVLGTVEGSDMVGWTYDGPFDHLPAQAAPGGYPKANPRLAQATGISSHRVIAWELVGSTEGTGIVHMAPGCGKEDYERGEEEGLVAIAPLDEEGVYIDGFGFLSGMKVPSEKTTEAILQDLRDRSILIAVEKYPHSYPHCWRCKTELVFRMVDEWFISMDELRYEIMEITRKITWMPEFGLQQELDWLKNMHDWMITKKRYWGLALPIYKCESCGSFDVIGSREELKERAKEGWEEFDGNTPHRPWIDAVRVACSDCGALASRIPDVGNPWLDAGIVPYSTVNYLSDPEYWSTWAPFDFITECFPGQFRNWFYCLLAMSTVMENIEPFKVVLGHALVKDENGNDMHKSSGNVIWFDDAAEEMGVDVMRWIFATQNPFANLNFGYALGREVKRKMLTLWNVCSFFVTYANLDNPSLDLPETADLSRLDRWLLARLERLKEKARKAYEGYMITPFAQEVERFIDELSNWYVRRSRRRFWKSESDTDKQAAYATLYHALTTLTRLIAPILPFTAEEMYQALVVPTDPAAPESVHLTPFPKAHEDRVDDELVSEMSAVSRVVNLALSARQTANLKVRQPLAAAVVLAQDEADRARLETYRDLIIEEINVKALRFVDTAEDLEVLTLRPKMALLGRKHGGRAQAVRQALLDLDPAQARAASLAETSVVIKLDGESISVLPEEYEVSSEAVPGLKMARDRDFMVAVDTELTEALRIEGLSRDVVRRIQNMRKDADFQVSDRIAVEYDAPEVLRNVLAECHDYIRAEVLAVSLTEVENPSGSFTGETKIAGELLRLGLTVKND